MDASVNRIKSSLSERALLVGLRINNSPVDDIQHSLDELKLLTGTAGATIVDSLIVRREKIDPSFIIGSGYVEKLKEIINSKNINLIVFDLNQIKPVQIRNLEESLKCRVLGRTEIILDIFAKRARSAESHIQVELAQLKYMLPRLKGLGEALSQTGGGIGTRGPGEKMLETDRRHIMQRISRLNQKLKKISGHRNVSRKARSGEVLGAVIGYTNAGKSSLLNKLAKDDLFVENRLFATLDSYTRRVFLYLNKQVLLTDTVGFITNLPANLVESFKSTLEEIQNADFLIHIIDISSNNLGKNIEVVNRELMELQCEEKPSILFFNKADLLENYDIIQNKYPDAIIGSVKQNIGLFELKQRIVEIFDRISKFIPPTIEIVGKYSST